MMRRLTFILVLLAWSLSHADDTRQDAESLPLLQEGRAPRNFDEMWAGFDPRAEPLEVKILKEWTEDDVVLRIVRFRIGVFKGQKAMLAGIYAFPADVAQSGSKVPGLVQIHGGGQYADHRACLANAKRGYATISIAWAGRISAPDYLVTPTEVQLFWEGKTDDRGYRLTTDWGAVDGYHAPSRNRGNAFPSAKSAPWTLDQVESPRNSGWFLCALAARRALTFLEEQSEVDPDRLGVYGHSMGGKLTVMAAVDSRVKAAAPSCGGVSDRYNDSTLFRSTLGDDVSLKKVSCPIIFLSPSNDFHGRIGDLPDVIREIASNNWRVTCSPHHSHQDSPEYEVATVLWFDQHLKGTFTLPQTPTSTLELETTDGVPRFMVRPDRTMPALSVDVYYTQHGKENETPRDRENTKHRFWHHAEATEADGIWSAKLPVSTTDKPLWVYANVLYPLEPAVTGAGYYYSTYTAKSFNLSSVMKKVSAAELRSASVQVMLNPSLVIESFDDGWEKEWFSYEPNEWGRATHKVYEHIWKAPDNARLAVDVVAKQPNTLVILIDQYAAEVQLKGGDQWQEIVLTHQDFRNHAGDSIPSWENIRQLKLSPTERLRPNRGDEGKSRIVGKKWKGERPRFRNLRWQTAPSKSVDTRHADSPPSDI